MAAPSLNLSFLLSARILIPSHASDVSVRFEVSATSPSKPFALVRHTDLLRTLGLHSYHAQTELLSPGATSALGY